MTTVRLDRATAVRLAREWLDAERESWRRSLVGISADLDWPPADIASAWSNWADSYSGRVPARVQALMVQHLLDKGCGKNRAYAAVAETVGHISADAVRQSYRRRLEPSPAGKS